MSSVRIFVPGDSAAVSVGADQIAKSISAEASARQLDVSVVRNGSRGLLWLEPMVEVETATHGRLAYGPVSQADIQSLFEADFLGGGQHALSLGPVEEIPGLKCQQRLCFENCGRRDPLDIAGYAEQGGFEGLRSALSMTAEECVEQVNRSGLRGRGGAAFPTGIKWKTALDAKSDEKFVVCNADEGDSGTFSDRMLMEGDPFLLIEGMLIAGMAIGARHGVIYLRSEYPQAHQVLNRAIEVARESGYLGADILGSGRRFDLELRLGAGAYICGEETSLLESLEGRRGQVRVKPPLPAIEGLFGKPTVINNVITLASVPIIFRKGADFYRDFGSGRSHGTLPVQLAGNIRRGGLYELAFGISLRKLIEDIGGGTLSGRPIKAVQVGGPLGAYLSADQLDVALDYEAIDQMGGMLGHGGIVVFDDSVNLAEQARFAMEFCALESCGKCTPCRIGSTRGVEVIDRLVSGENPEQDEVLLRDLCDTMTHGSLCALGGLTPSPVLSALDQFPDDFSAGRHSVQHRGRS